MTSSKVGAICLLFVVAIGVASNAAVGQILKDYLPEPPAVSPSENSLSSFADALTNLQKRDVERDKAVRPRTRHDEPLEKSVPGGSMPSPTK